MSELKTKVNDSSVEDFLSSVENPTRREDGFKLLEMYKQATGQPAKMWGSSMIGFGLYHYKSERSAQEGDWPLAAFSPRKQNLTLYFVPGFEAHADTLPKLGKHTLGKGCLYINKLADVDVELLAQMIANDYQVAKKMLT